MIDKNNFIYKLSKNGNRKKRYKAFCDECGADRGYKKSTYANYLCRHCATRKSSKKRAKHIYDNVDYNDFVRVPAPTKNKPDRMSLKYKTNCVECGRDKGYSRAKDFLKPCLICAAKLRHKKMSLNSKLKTNIKISCTQQNISVNNFNGFSTPKNEKERSFFKSKIRQQCFKNANYTCDIYNVKGVALNAHHLYSWHNNEDKRFAIGNLVCLSEIAHKTFHHLYGHKNNTAQQYKEFKDKIQKRIKNKQDLYLICGAPASGKTWVCNQLMDMFNYISFDNINKNYHVYKLLMANDKPLLYDPTIKISTFTKYYGHLFNIKRVVIIESLDTIQNRMKLRKGKVTKTINNRIQRMQQLSNGAVFSGTSDQVLEYLKKSLNNKKGR